MNVRLRHSIPRLYYFLTPAFVLLDYFGGLNIRVAVLEQAPLYKGLYYGFCVLCGVLIYLRPGASPVVALAESGINFLMTILALILPYFQLIFRLSNDLNADIPEAVGFSLPHIINLALAGGIAALTFKTCLNTISQACGLRDTE